MGSCTSTTNGAAGAVDRQPTTAKVITLTGSLREYPSHLTAGDVLAGDRPSCFLCSSDELFYDDRIPPLDFAEPLQSGQIYFVLPAEKLRHPLSRSDMKELVVKASSALQLASASEKGSGKKRKGKKEDGIIVPVLEVDGSQRGGGGGDDMDHEVKKVYDKENYNPQAVWSATTIRRSERRCGSVRGMVGFRSRCSPGLLSAIPEVVDQ